MAALRNYFDYFPVTPKLKAWGLYATGFGAVHVPPGAPYPPPGHPGRHAFDWERGRVLGEYQIVYLHKGRGAFESARTKRRPLRAGMAFLLFPGVWHRYRPDPRTGWTESWIEVKGPFLDRLRRAGVLDPRTPVHPLPAGAEIEPRIAEAAALARLKPPGFAVRLGLVAGEILALLRFRRSPARGARRRMDQVISECQARFAANPADPRPLEEIARQCGVGYSYFRRQFKAQTGLSPKQYRIDVRHRRARHLLLNSALTVKEISEQLGYSSPFHLSQEFSRLAGASPQHWRRRAG